MSKIPRNWRYVKIDEIANRSSGHTPDKKVREYWGGDIKWISLKDTKKLDKGFIYDTEDSTTSEGIKNSSAVLLPARTIVISRDATVGKIGIMAEPMATSQHFINYTCSDEIEYMFLYYYLQYIKPEFEKAASGSTIKTIGLSFFKKLRIMVPPIYEQQKISEILSTWDSAIEKQEQFIKKKKEFKKGLIQRLLSGEARFNDFEDKWIKVKLGEVFKERKEIGYNNLELLAITTANGVVRRTEVDIRDTSSDDKSKYKRILPGDIGYNTMRMWQGVSGLSIYEGIVSPAYTILKPTNKIDSEYMAYLFKLPSIINLFYRHSQGLVSDTLNLKYDNFKNIKVIIPNSIDEQKKIAEVLVTSDKEIELLEKELEVLKLQKKGLMQRLLTGEVRVKL